MHLSNLVGLPNLPLFRSTNRLSIGPFTQAEKVFDFVLTICTGCKYLLSPGTIRRIFVRKGLSQREKVGIPVEKLQSNQSGYNLIAIVFSSFPLTKCTGYIPYSYIVRRDKRTAVILKNISIMLYIKHTQCLFCRWSALILCLLFDFFSAEK